MKKPLNVLLIVTDQCRYDILGVNGSKICKSPNLDRLAADGVNFSRAYTICPLCTPARSSLYSGRTLNNHGIVRNTERGTINGGSLGDEVPSIAQYLKAKNYNSFFFGKWHAGRRNPTECGFSGIDAEGYGNALDHPDYQKYLEENGLEKPSIETIGVGYPHNLMLAGKMSGGVESSVPYYLAERTIEKLQHLSDSEEPFFLALNFWGPHAPYLPCEPFASMYDPKDIPPWGNFEDNFEGKPPVWQRHHDSFVGEGNSRRSWEECAQWAALYFGFATQIDSQIGRVLESLEQNNLAEDTVVIFTSDHGDLCGSHGGLHDKNALMCEELMHIPMIVRHPKLQQENPICDQLVSLLDIPATVMDIAGGEVPETFDGNSLLPLIKENETKDWPDHVIGQCYGVHFNYETRMVVYKNFKYIFHPGAFDELYDLGNDPVELTNLINSPDHTDILRECRRRMLKWMQEKGDMMDRAFFLFAKHEEWTQDSVSSYGPQAVKQFFTKDPVLFNDSESS